VNAALTPAVSAYDGDRESGPWPWTSRLVYLAGMGGLIAYDLTRGNDTADGVLFCLNVAGTGIVFPAADWLWVKKPR
jgi:hypothetical protein